MVMVKDVLVAEAERGRTNSSVLDRGVDGVDHESECFGLTCNHSRKREAATTSAAGEGGGEVSVAEPFGEGSEGIAACSCSVGGA